MKKTAAVILAAGESRRMGRPKLLLPWKEGCVLDAVLTAVTAASFEDRVLVSGAFRTQVEEVARRHGIRSVYNREFAAGQSTSLHTGLKSLGPDTAAMFILADQPLLTAALLEDMLAAYRESGAVLLQPRTMAGRTGHPVLFGPEFFPELLRVSGDEGGRCVLQAHAKEITYLPVADDSIWQDMDTPEDYYRLRGK